MARSPPSQKVRRFRALILPLILPNMARTSPVVVPDFIGALSPDRLAPGWGFAIKEPTVISFDKCLDRLVDVVTPFVIDFHRIAVTPTPAILHVHQYLLVVLDPVSLF